MKRLLQISLLANLVLLGLAGWTAHRQHELAMTRVVRTEAAPPGAGRFRRRLPPALVAVAPRTPWDAIESKDLVRLIANLRAVGCPEPTIRDLVTLRVCRKYCGGLLDREAEDERAWDYTRFRNPRQATESRGRQNELRNTMDTELEALLGVSASQLKDVVLGWPDSGDDFDYLPLEKRGLMREFRQRYQRLEEEARQGLSPWDSDPAVDLRVKELERQKQVEMSTLFTAQELEAFNLRESPAAKYVLSHLPEAKSEAEFKTMVQAVVEVGIEGSEASDLRHRLGIAGGSDTSDAERQQAEKQAQLDARLKELLGAQRTAEQQQEEQARLAEEQQQEQARQEQQQRDKFAAVAESAGISADDANRFFDRLKEAQKELQPRMEALEKSLTGTPQEKEQQMQAAMQAELDKLATETLGDKGPAVVKKLMEQGH